jgi:predicted Rdx family selenoprotein
MTDSEPNCVDCEQQQATPTVPGESLSDPATFVAPATLASPRIVIEFCNRVRTRNILSRDIGRDSLGSVDGDASKAFAAALTLRLRDRLHRAQWVATELFLTFPPPELASISVVPLTSDETAGRFRVWVFADPSPTLVWDRKVEGGFPELKVLVEMVLPAWSGLTELTIPSEQKQRIRDRIQPGKSLGHSDAGAGQ